MMGKFSYLKRCMFRQFKNSRFSCPNCGEKSSVPVDRKYVISQLRRCSSCELLFRTPTEDAHDNELYYEHEYSQEKVTDLPSEAALSAFVENNFSGSELDWAHRIETLRLLGVLPGMRIFDFGCSWGYGSYQMAKAGYHVTGFEVSPTRRAFAQERLGIETVSDMEKFVTDQKTTGIFDVFFLSHVLEHVPCPAGVFEAGKALLRKGGLWVSFTPNGSEAARRVFPQWRQWWGEVHPHLIDDRFLDRAFHDWPRVIGSTPLSSVTLPSVPKLVRLDGLTGEELFFAARKA